MRYIYIILAFLMVSTTVAAFRIPRPNTYSLPWTRDQINRLNDDLENIWNLQNGEFNFDVVTSVKTRADNGDLYMIKTGSVVRIQFRANNHTYTITPDGY